MESLVRLAIIKYDGLKLKPLDALIKLYDEHVKPHALKRAKSLIREKLIQPSVQKV